MPGKRIKSIRSTQVLAATMTAELQRLPLESPKNPAELRNRVRHLASLYADLRELGLAHVKTLLPASSAAERILQYLQLFVREEVEGVELEVVSGISEYARRVREWRVEFGWPITHTGTRYKLEALEPDADKAELWRTLNAIRNIGQGGRARMLELFKRLPIGTIISTAQLRYVTEGKDMRRVRELRTQFGWRIMTKKTGMPHLKPDQYVLVDPEPMPEHDRHVEIDTIIKVLNRDASRCRKCGWHPDNRVPGDPRQYIELHHIVFHADRGPNEPENLVTLCNAHHREIHKLKLSPAQLESWLAQK